jgi:hypothetical protein
MSIYTPTITTFKAFFDRGQFTYGDDTTCARDSDISEAISEAEAVFNPDLYPVDTPDIGTKAEMYLTAHFLQCDIEACDSGGQAKNQQVSRSADGVSESVNIPDWMKQGDFALYSTTYYGQKYLLLSRPYLGGAVFVVGGATQY